MNLAIKKFRVVLFIFFISFSPLSYGVIYTVTNNTDAGVGSLRDAITLANANAGADEIHFQISGSNKIITLLTALPILEDSIIINGNTQPGFVFPSNMVTLFSTNSFAYGLKLHSNNISIQGLKFQNFANGVCIFSDNQFVSDTLFYNLFISGNVFQDSKFGVIVSYSGFQNVIFSYNKFLNCTYTNIDFNPLFPSRDITIYNNEISGDSIAPNTKAISLTRSSSSGSLINVNIILNSIQSCHDGIYIEGLSAIDSLNIVSNNIVTTNLMDRSIRLQSYGVNSNTYSNLNIENNDLSGGVKIDASLFNQITSFNNLTIVNNIINGGFIINSSGTGSVTINYSNILVKNNSFSDGFVFWYGGTGNYVCFVDSVSFIGNSISNSTNGAIKIQSGGTGNSFCQTSNILVRNNFITNSNNEGIYISSSTNSTARSYFDDIVIDSNLIDSTYDIGIFIMSSAFMNSPNNRIKNVLICDNVISNSSRNGIRLNATTTSPFTEIHILRNSIFGSGQLGILESSTSLYANPKLPEPVLDWVNSSAGIVAGHLQSLPLRSYEIQFYANQNQGFGGFGEGEFYFATQLVTTDSTGYVSFQESIPSNFNGMFYSCTATDTVVNSTSQFSNSIDSAVTSQFEIESAESSFIVFPNPANGSASLYRVDSSDELQIDLCDMTGRVIHSVAFPFGVNSITISLEGLSSGMYLITGRSGQNRYKSAKLLIRKE